MKDNLFNKTSRQCTLDNATDSVNKMFNSAESLFKTHYKWGNPLRSIGIRAANLETGSQLMLCDSEENDIIDETINRYVKQITSRLGVLQVEIAGGLFSPP